MNAALEPRKTAAIEAPGGVTGNAALCYLAGLTSHESRRRMVNALRTVARLLTGCGALCKCDVCDPLQSCRRRRRHLVRML